MTQEKINRLLQQEIEVLQNFTPEQRAKWKVALDAYMESVAIDPEVNSAAMNSALIRVLQATVELRERGLM